MAAPTGSTYQTFTVPIEYNEETGVPESAIITIIVEGENDGTPGSVMIIDNLALITTPTSVAESGHAEVFSLAQNYPNPFNPTTTIAFALPEAAYVTLAVYNILGEEVAVVLSEDHQPGTYEATWDASESPSGVYLYRLTAGDFVETRRMVLMR
jgi:hypothetical protein